METSESRYRRPHGGHRQDRLQTQGSIVNAPLAKRPRKNPLVLSEAVSQIRRVNVPLLIAGLISRRHAQRDLVLGLTCRRQAGQTGSQGFGVSLEVQGLQTA